VLASGDKGAYQSVVLSLGPQYVFTTAGAAPIEQFCRRVLALFGEGVGPAQAGALAYLGYIYALQGRPADALQAASQAQAMVQELGSFAHLELYIDHVFLLDALNRSDEAAFNAYFDRIRSRIEGVLTYRQWLACYSYLAGRMAWLRQRDEALWQVYSGLAATIIPHELPEAQVGRLLLDSLLARRQQRYAEAEASLHQAIAAQSWLRHPLLLTDARLTLADLYLEWHRPEAALAELRPILAELEQRGMPGVLAQEGPRAAALLRLAQQHHLAPTLVQRALVLLGLDAPPPSPPAPATFTLPAVAGGESLSARELEVLHLLALGLTNQEIAQELVIAPGTAKRHTINIYGKLGVNNRTRAVARAKALRLI
jgi:ATP/maltotriose-dependent transcriptional regulator MalT